MVYLICESDMWSQGTLHCNKTHLEKVQNSVPVFQ